MNPRCIQAVADALGRSPTKADIDRIQDDTQLQMRLLARTDPNWRSMSAQERTMAGAEAAARQLRSDRVKAQWRAVQQVTAQARQEHVWENLRQAQEWSGAKALGRILERANAYVKGIGQDYFSQLMDALEAAQPRFLGFLENRPAVRDFVHEVFGEDSGNPVAERGAKAWLETVEAMRQRFNRAGGDVGKLDYGYLPQAHDANKIRDVGVDKWVSDTLPLLDRGRYLHEDGRQYSNTELDAFLRQSYESIVTDGLNKKEPGQFAQGKRADRGTDTRQIHFGGADRYLSYQDAYGHGRTFDQMQHHIHGLARDIGLIEQFGPNPESSFRYLNDLARKADNGTKHFGPLLVTAENMWDALTGKVNQADSDTLASVAQGVRNFETATKLGSAFLSSFTDIPTMLATAHFNGLPMFQSAMHMLRAFGKEDREYANRAGLVAESVISDMNRWAESNIGQGWTARLANATMRASLLQAWTDAIRRGFSIQMMGAFGKMIDTDWGALADGDRARLEAKGITEAEWKLWQLATPQDFRGSKMLSAQTIRDIPAATLEREGFTQANRDAAISKLLGFITDEAEYASLGRDLATHAAVTRGTRKGTVAGEIVRSVGLFKGFSMAMLSRHVSRAMEMDSRLGAAGYAASLIFGLSLFGYLSMAAKDIASGKDPRSTKDPKTWAAAFSQGGGLGIYGDMLYTGMGGNSRSGQPNWSSLAGPIAGDIADTLNLTLGNLGQFAGGQKTNAGAETIRFVKQHLPFINLWYTRAALDHMFFNEMQEYANPGYLSDVRAAARQNYNQAFWWDPAQKKPSRAPNLSPIVGQ